MCSDRLDTDFPDIDLSQLDTSDFDSVNCLSELQWCNDQPADASPASIHYSTTDELFEVRFLHQNTVQFNCITTVSLESAMDRLFMGEGGHQMASEI